MVEAATIYWKSSAQEVLVSTMDFLGPDPVADPAHTVSMAVNVLNVTRWASEVSELQEIVRDR